MAGSDSPRSSRISLGTIIVLILVFLVAVWLTINWLTPPSAGTPEIPLSQVIQDAKAGKIDTIKVSGDKLTVLYLAKAADGTSITRESRVGSGVDLAALLGDQGITIGRTSTTAGEAAVNLEFEKAGGIPAWVGIVIGILPYLLIGLFVWWIFRQSRNIGAQTTGFGKSRARLFSGDKVVVTFNDVAGVDEAKEELAEVVEFLRSPQKFAALGARIPRGVLLLGPPGTGKTLLARAVAGEAGVPFFSISGSEFVELFVGVGASRVRDLFEQAKQNSPCIIFLDEIDAVGRQRGAGLGGGNDEREQTLNQILVEMDGFESSTHVVVIAATNRPDILDAALLRPGRFDRKVVLDTPDLRGRQAILRVHTRGKPLAADVSIETLSKATPGFTGADLANLVNEAAILSARADRPDIGMREFEEAIDRVIAGPERKGRVISERERKLTAYHEGGHAVVAHFLEHHDVPQKVTIVSHGVAGGYTRFLPQEEFHFRTPEMFRDQLCAGLAGHAAEEFVFGQASTGPSNDLEQVTRLARSMVMRWGMSETLGPRTFGRTEELVFLGREISETRDYSEEIAAAIDLEIHKLIEEAHAQATRILKEHRALLDKLAAVLLEVETLEGDELQRLLDEDPALPWKPAGPEPLPLAPETPPEPEKGLAWPA